MHATGQARECRRRILCRLCLRLICHICLLLCHLCFPRRLCLLHLCFPSRLCHLCLCHLCFPRLCHPCFPRRLCHLCLCHLCLLSAPSRLLSAPSRLLRHHPLSIYHGRLGGRAAPDGAPANRATKIGKSGCRHEPRGVQRHTMRLQHVKQRVQCGQWVGKAADRGGEGSPMEPARGVQRGEQVREAWAKARMRRGHGISSHRTAALSRHNHTADNRATLARAGCRGGRCRNGECAQRGRLVVVGPAHAPEKSDNDILALLVPVGGATRIGGVGERPAVAVAWR